MKNIIDFTKHECLKSFPWESVYEGLAKSKKTVTTFYGDIHSTKFNHTADARWTDKDQWRWFNSLKHGVNIEGFNVNLTMCKTMAFSDYWWARSHESERWVPTNNLQYFIPLQNWISSSGIFKSTGRQVFFIQIKGQNSPTHIDFDPLTVPENLRSPTDFIWLTPPDNPKSLVIDGVNAPWCCWFNHFIPHGSLPEENTRWSLRIDGVFSDSFRNSNANSNSIV